MQEHNIPTSHMHLAAISNGRIKIDWDSMPIVNVKDIMPEPANISNVAVLPDDDNPAQTYGETDIIPAVGVHPANELAEEMIPCVAAPNFERELHLDNIPIQQANIAQVHPNMLKISADIGHILDKYVPAVNHAAQVQQEIEQYINVHGVSALMDRASELNIQTSEAQEQLRTGKQEFYDLYQEVVEKYHLLTADAFTQTVHDVVKSTENTSLHQLYATAADDLLQSCKTMQHSNHMQL